MESSTARKKKPFLGMYFKCCHVYSRLYLNKTGKKFSGYCPKCLAKIEVKVSPTGRKDRFFTAQ